jgi:hypothetical protein
MRLKIKRFRDNPLVLGDPHLRFYAGVPLRTEEGWRWARCAFWTASRGPAYRSSRPRCSVTLPT